MFMYNIERNGQLVLEDGKPKKFSDAYVNKWKHTFKGCKLIKLEPKKNRQKESAGADKNTEKGSASE